MKLETKYDVGQPLFLIRKIEPAKLNLPIPPSCCAFCGGTRTIAVQGMNGKSASFDCQECKNQAEPSIDYLIVGIRFASIRSIQIEIEGDGDGEQRVQYEMDFNGIHPRRPEARFSDDLVAEETVTRQLVEAPLVLFPQRETELVAYVRQYLKARAKTYVTPRSAINTTPLVIQIDGIPKETTPREIRVDWPTGATT